MAAHFPPFDTVDPIHIDKSGAVAVRLSVFLRSKSCGRALESARRLMEVKR